MREPAGGEEGLSVGCGVYIGGVNLPGFAWLFADRHGMTISLRRTGLAWLLFAELPVRWFDVTGVEVVQRFPAGAQLRVTVSHPSRVDRFNGLLSPYFTTRPRFKLGLAPVDREALMALMPAHVPRR